MPHKHNNRHPHYPVSKSREWIKTHSPDSSARSTKPTIDFVLKCDSAGCLEAVTADVLKQSPTEADISIIHSGVGDINTSDIIMAESGSRLVVGFQVDVLPGVDHKLVEHGVEVRLYDVIYQLNADLKNIAESLTPDINEEESIGNAVVVALFKSSRKGIIIGCEVKNGCLAQGKHFRIISAMGPVYTGIIESMHIDNNAVQKATSGQKAGIKIRNFNRVHIGDLVECYHPSPPLRKQVWRPSGKIIRMH